MSPAIPRRFFPRPLTIVLCLLAFGLAVMLDRVVVEFAIPHRRTFMDRKLLLEWKGLGESWVCFVVVIVVGVLHRFGWRAALLVVVSGLLGGGIETILKWVVGRTRPVIAKKVVNIAPYDIEPFRGGFAGITRQENLCFPSGHAMLAFSTAACLAYLCPRGKWIWFLGAVLVCVQRVGEAAHYLSDVVGAAMLGILASMLARAILRMPQTGDGSDLK